MDLDRLSLSRLIAVVVFAGTYIGLGVGRLPVFRVDRVLIGVPLTVVTLALGWLALTLATG